MTATYTPTQRARIKRARQRAHYDHETVHAILDAGLIAHVGYVIDGQPFVTATCHWRRDDVIYWHGSAASRMLRAIGGGVPVCVTVTHFDGIVLARSGFHSSINYRSVTAFGRARKVEDRAEKLAALEALVERITPGRWPELRPPNAKEIKATTVVAMPIEEAAAKVRSGTPADDAADYALPLWAGVLPVRAQLGAPEPDPRLDPGTPAPDYLGRVTVA